MEAGRLTEFKYRGSHESVGKTILKYATHTGHEALRYFELVLFSFLSGNADMHLKNFSLMTLPDGTITLKPAYDMVATRLLIPKSQDHEELALTLNGKKSNLRIKDFRVLAQALNVTDTVMAKTIQRFTSRLPQMETKIQASFLSPKKQNAYRDLLHQRFHQIH